MGSRVYNKLRGCLKIDCADQNFAVISSEEYDV